MSASATLSVALPAPDPDRRRPDAPPRIPASRVGRLLRILHGIMAYGANLLTALQQNAPSHRRAMAMVTFGTRDIALIIARIKCGLMRAAALEDRLNEYVESGRDLPLARPLGLAAARARTEGDDVGAADAEASPRPPHSTVLALLPSAEEIADQVRMRPLETVLADICRDLGMTRVAFGGVLWTELMELALECGFDLTGVIMAGAHAVFGDEYDDPVALSHEVTREERAAREASASARRPP